VSAISVTTTPQAIVVNPSGQAAGKDYRLVIHNKSAVEVFVGPTSAVTTTNGISLAAGEKWEYPSPLYPNGKPDARPDWDVWLVVATGTADVRWDLF
jgi:hypothetical protein